MTKKPELARREGNVFVGVLGIRRALVRFLVKPLHRHFLRRYHGTYRHARKLFTLDLALITTIIALAGIATYVIFFRTTVADRVILRTEPTPSEIISGERVTFTVSYENRNRETLTDVDLGIRLPPHFTFLQSFPKDFNTKTGSVFLSDLPPGAHGQAKITGILWADVGQNTLVYTTLTFSTEDDSRGIKFNRAELPVRRSVIALTPTFPSKLVAGQPVAFDLRITNESDRDLEGIAIAPTWPDGFRPTDFGEKWRDGRWHIDLPAQSETVLSGRGTLPTTDRVTFIFTPTITTDGAELTQGTYRLEFPLVPPPITLDVSLEAEPVIGPGDHVTARVAYHNTSEIPVTDARIGIRITSPFSETSDAFRPSAATIAEIPPNASGVIEIPFTIGSTLPTQQKNLTINVRPYLTGFLVDGTPVAIELEGREITRRLASRFALNAFARYWTPQGDQLGRGPLPPVVNETTKYWIFWNLAPTTNDLEHLTLSAQLPPTVEFTNRASVTIESPLHWNAATRTVSWTIDRLDATQNTGTVISARFEVALTPTADQVGTIPILIKAVHASARDLFVESEITTSAPAITTALPGDRRVAGRSRIVPF